MQLVICGLESWKTLACPAAPPTFATAKTGASYGRAHVFAGGSDDRRGWAPASEAQFMFRSGTTSLTLVCAAGPTALIIAE